MLPPVSLEVMSDVGVLAYVMSLGREHTESLIRSRSSTGQSEGVAFVKAYNGDIFPLIAAAALENLFERGVGDAGDIADITALLHNFYNKNVLGDIDGARKSRAMHCSKPGCAKQLGGRDGFPSGATKLLQCSRCKYVCYCSRECQEEAWSGGHKRECRGMAELWDQETAFRAAVTTCRDHHWELSAAAAHWLLVRGPGALVVSCENWLAFAPGQAGTAMWKEGNRPANRLLRVSYTPLSQLDPATRSHHRPWMAVLDATPASGLDVAKEVAASRALTSMFIVFHDECGHVFTLRAPMAPHALAVQDVLGLGQQQLVKAEGASKAKKSSTASKPSQQQQQALRIHHEDAHAFAQTDVYIIDVGRPAAMDYSSVNPSAASSAASGAAATGMRYVYASPQATRVALDFHTWTMAVTATTDADATAGTEADVNGGDAGGGGTARAIAGVPAPRLIALANTLIAPDEAEDDEDAPASIDQWDDASVASRLGLPTLMDDSTDAADGDGGAAALPSSSAAAASSSSTAVLSAQSLLQQLQADGILPNGSNNSNSSGSSSDKDPLAGVKAAGKAALAAAADASQSQQRPPAGLVTMGVEPFGFDHATGIMLGEGEAKRRLREGRTPWTTDMQSSDSAASSPPSPPPTATAAAAAGPDPSCYQVLPCPGWGALARERLKLYRVGAEADQAVVAVASPADTAAGAGAQLEQTDATATATADVIPATYEMYGICVFAEEDLQQS